MKRRIKSTLARGLYTLARAIESVAVKAQRLAQNVDPVRADYLAALARVSDELKPTGRPRHIQLDTVITHPDFAGLMDRVVDGHYAAFHAGGKGLV